MPAPRFLTATGAPSDDDTLVFRVKLDWQHRLSAEQQRVDAVIHTAASASFRHLHIEIQRVMGWYPGRLYHFRLPNERWNNPTWIGPPDPDEGPDEPQPLRDAAAENLADHLPRLLKGVWYTYDMAQGWDHRVTLAGWTSSPDTLERYPVAVRGRMPGPKGTFAR